MIVARTKTLVMFDRSIFRKNWKKINEGPQKKAGLYVRKIAIRSIRRGKKKPSKPGTPPRTRAAGDPMRRIYSVPMRGGRGVIVGALKLSGVSRGEPVPGLHEHGGDKTIEVIDPAAKKRVIAKQPTTEGQRKAFHKLARAKDPRVELYLRQNRAKLEALRKRKSVSFPERPFMAPALQKALPKLPAMWSGSVR
jgi:hypothetical protein